jgi:LmeA-like phospholipid-binding
MAFVRRSCLGALLVPLFCLLVALGVIAVAVDRVSLWIAERAVSSQVEKAGGQTVSTTAYGFPFLTQALHRDFEHVRITAGSIAYKGLRGNDVHLDLHDVRPRGTSALDVGRLTGDAAVPFREIEQRAGQPAGSLSASGRSIRIRRTARVLGRTITVTALASIAPASGNRVTARLTSVTATGTPLPAAVQSALRKQLAVTYAVPGIPKGVQLTRSEVVPGGVRVFVTGRDAVLTK